jgi:hypothetical protein
VADITVSVSSPGILGFGQGLFGDLNFGGENLSATFSVGGVQFVFNTGWGSNDWGVFTWGVTGDSAEVSGLQLNVFYGLQTIKIDVGVSVQGQQLNTIIAGVTTKADANVTEQGLQLNTQINSVTAGVNTPANVQGSRINLIEGDVTVDIQPDAGWGVAGWGIVPWGLDNDVIVPVTGTRINTIVFAVDINADGNESVNIQDERLFFFTPTGSTTVANANVNVTGSRINVAEGGNNEIVQVDVIVPVTGTRINTIAGQAVGGTIQQVNVTGSRINLLIGNETTSANANVNVTGSRLNIAPGGTTVNFTYDVTGSRINTLINSVTVTANAVVNVTGSRLNIRTGSVNITAWAEVQTGANNTWNPVDLAA